MTDSSVPITAGLGTSIDTRRESTNNNHRQVIVIGDPSTNAGIAPVSASGGLKVDLGIDNDVSVTGTVDVNIVSGSSSGTQYAEDAAHVSGNTGTMMLAVRQDTVGTALAGTSGDYIPLITNSEGKLVTIVANRKASATLAGVNQSVSLNVEGLSMVTATIEDNTLVGSWGVSGTDEYGNSFAIEYFYPDGSKDEFSQGNSVSELVGQFIYIPCAGFKTVKLYISSYTSGTATGYLTGTYGGEIDFPVIGELKNDQPDFGGPIKIGGYAKATAPTAVSADGDRVNAWFDLNGRLQVGDGGSSLTVDNTSLTSVNDILADNILSLNGLKIKSSEFSLIKKSVLPVPQTTSGNSTMAFDGDHTCYFYVPKATNSEIYSYDLLTDTVAAITNGTTLSEAYSGATMIYAAGKLYFTRGGGYKTFYKINTDGTSFTTLTNPTNDINFGCALAWDGDNYIYQINSVPSFERYSISGNSWTVRAVPATTGTEGLSLTFAGNGKIYSMQGAGATGFAVYDVATNAWTSKAATPGTVYDGGALAWNGDAYLYAFRGIGSTDFWKYDLLANTWTATDELPVPASTGSTIIPLKNGTFLCYIAEPSAITAFGTVNNLYVFDPGIQGTLDTELPPAVTLAVDAATPTAPAVGSFLMGYDYASSNWNPIRADGFGIPDVYASGGGGVKLQQGASGDGYALNVGGGVAHDAADSGNPIKLGGYAKTAAPTNVSADGDRVNAWFDLAGRLQVGDGGTTLSIDDGSGSITVDGTVGVSGTVTVDSELPAAAALGDATANPTVPGVAAYGMNFNGSTLDRTRGDAYGTWVQGPRAHDAPYNTTGPVLIGAYASTSAPTAVGADGNAVRLWSDRNGRLQIGDGGGSLTVDGTVTATPEKASSATLSNVSGSATSVTLKASNSSRKKLTIFNDSTANLYVKYGATASTTSFSYKMTPNDTLEEITYTGIVDGIWDSATGAARVTEL